MSRNLSPEALERRRLRDRLREKTRVRVRPSRRGKPRADRPTVGRRVRVWLEAGNTGTVPEICAALGVSACAVVAAMAVLQDLGVAERIDTRAIRYGASNGVVHSPVYALRTDSASMPVVQRALLRRLPIERVWAGEQP